MSRFLCCVPHKVNAYTDILMWKFVSNNIFDFVFIIYYYMRLLYETRVSMH